MTNANIAQSFAIRFTNCYDLLVALESDLEWPQTTGEIEIAGYRLPGQCEPSQTIHRESFFVPLQVWAYTDYVKQWDDALQRLSNGKSVSCFLTAVTTEDDVYYLQYFGFWRVADEYRIQEMLDNTEHCTTPFDPHHPYGILQHYSNMTQDGERIYDDWGLPIDTFKKEQKKKQGNS